MYNTKGRCKYSLKVHVVLAVKYRKKLLNSDTVFALKAKLLQIAEQSNFYIELMEADDDHIHLLIDYEPQVSLSAIVRRIKQETTAHLWRLQANRLKSHFWKEKTFWSDGYFACSIGEGASYDTIKEYIKSQG